MSCGSQYAPELRSRGFRVTVQRMAVLHVLQHAESRLSPSEVWHRAREDMPGLTETTVYRTLGFLARNGLVWPIRLGTGHLVYEFAGIQHHHLICRQCGSEIELEHALVKDVYARLEAASGYRLSDDHLTLFGLCPDCQRTNAKRGS